MVVVAVGTNEDELQRFSVHRDIICQYSAYFRAACTGEFVQAKSGKFKLLEHRAEIFDLFLQWLYSQNLQQVLANVELPSWTTLIELYMLADTLLVQTLKNAIMDRLLCKAHVALRQLRCRERFPSNADISLAYENTPPTSPMTKFLSELFALLRDFTIEKDEIPKDYLYDLALGLRLRLDGSSGLPPLMKEPCRYHEHDSAEKSKCTRPIYCLG